MNSKYSFKDPRRLNSEHKYLVLTKIEQYAFRESLETTLMTLC